MGDYDFSYRPDPYALVSLLERCALYNGVERENAVRLARYAAECLGPLLDAADRAKGTLQSAEFHIKNGSWDKIRSVAVGALDAALSADPRPSGQEGYWLNKYWSEDGWHDCDPEARHLNAYTVILSDRYASEEDARRAGETEQRDAKTPGHRWYDPDKVVTYLGPVFFPADNPDP